MPCPVCDEEVPVKLTHRDKPYWQCDECGVQVFVRRQEGMKRLEDKGEEEELFR
jgi:DNA-directed RNA polymerase subunit RPC12/RpoP